MNLIKQVNFLDKIVSYATYVLLISVCFELIAFSSTSNLLACIVLVYGWFLIRSSVLTNNVMIKYPVSFLMIFGWSIFHFILPIPLTLIEFKGVTHNMIVPFLTFFHQFLLVNVIVITHFVYRNITKSGNFFRTVLQKTNFYVTPTTSQIHITAILGLASSFYIYFVFGTYQTEFQDKSLLSYTAVILSQFNWMPFLLLFPKLINITKKTSKGEMYFITIYSIALAVISIVSNFRTQLFAGVMLIFALGLVGFVFGIYELQKTVTPKKLLLILSLSYFVSGPLVDVGLAMVSVRSDRTSIDANGLLQSTWEAYQNKGEIARTKELFAQNFQGGANTLLDWDESYLSNTFFNRLCNLKISDGCLFHAQRIGYENIQMQEELIKQLKAGAPNFMARFLDISQSDRLQALSYSITDKLYSISRNNPYLLGSAIIGSLPGVGMAIFGYWYLLIVFFIFLFTFSMFDSFVDIKKNKIIFSFYFFIILVSAINYFNDRHVYVYDIRYIYRTYFENIIIFLIIMKVVRFIEGFFKVIVK